jgi:hypothetical protein
MRVTLARTLLLFLGLLTASTPSFASPGDASAVLAHCGTPQSDTTATSEVDDLPQRTLTYDHTRLNFQQLQGVSGAGWSFTSGWVGPLPMSAREIANRMPCFRDALDEASARYQNRLSHVDPSIAARAGTIIGQPHGAFGINHLWLIVFLIGIIAIFALAIPRRRRRVTHNPVVRPYRRPDLTLKPSPRKKPRSPSDRL